MVIRGEPGPALINVASFTGDLLVVGAGRRGRTARIWHGRVSRYCLAHALCPVLTVPRPPPSPRRRGTVCAPRRSGTGN